MGLEGVTFVGCQVADTWGKMVKDKLPLFVVREPTDGFDAGVALNLVENLKLGTDLVEILDDLGAGGIESSPVGVLGEGEGIENGRSEGGESCQQGEGCVVESRTYTSHAMPG